MFNLLYGLLGLLVGIVINVLADSLPQKRPLHLYCAQCGQISAGVRCAACETAVSHRFWLVIISTTALFAFLPGLIPNRTNLLINSFYIGALILIIVIDLEHRLILNRVVLPLTAVALLGSFFVTQSENTIGLALVGGLVGYIIFGLIYAIGQKMFGVGALGFGDVKLAMALGAMLGFQRIFFCLMLGILLGGIISLLLILSGRVKRNSYLPYGQYLALAGIIMLIWGQQIVAWYVQ